jgi:DNA repair protein RecO (recombination protein O)
MRPKYKTRAIVLARNGLGEANLLVTLLTDEVGLVRARAQGVRKSNAKLAPSLTTLAESEVMLVRGAEGWRVAGASLVDNWFTRIGNAECRRRATRIVGLYLRLVSGEVVEPRLFDSLQQFFRALASAPVEEHEAAEILAALELLAALGLDAGVLPSGRDARHEVIRDRRTHIARVNRGIEASGL